METYSHYNREEGWRRICEILASEGDGTDLLAMAHRLTRQLVRSPRDPWLRLARGVVETDLGRFEQAFQDFAYVERNARMPWLKAFSRGLLNELERWQLSVLSTLLSEDRAFRTAFRADARKALRDRGFCLSPMGHELLGALERTVLRNTALPPGLA
ncbi:MAG: hypothetical protein D6724_11450 [Armatimonadetes bacterium]|nr:MAG: hypothetical protein D6724_11450 [Armatimonadota bacterium]